MIPAYRRCRSLERLAQLEAIRQARPFTEFEAVDYRICLDNEKSRRRYHATPRQPKGMWSKLKPEQVEAIRARLPFEPVTRIAADYGVCHRTIGRIRDGVCWGRAA